MAKIVEFGNWVCTYHNHNQKVLCHYQDDDLEYEIDLYRQEFEDLEDPEGYLNWCLANNI